MTQPYGLPKRCPAWCDNQPVAYLGLQPWWLQADPGGEHPHPAVDEVLFAMEYRRCRIERVRRFLHRSVGDSEAVLREAPDAPNSPLLLEGWWPGPSGRHWAVHLYGRGGVVLAHRQVSRFAVLPGARRLVLAPAS